MSRKSTQLRALLGSPQLEFLMEAHNGLSAKIVEEAGFRGIWASGLAISAALGVRDNNEASWTQVLDVAEFMSDASSIPILLDADTGYGNFNNARRLVRKLEQRDIAGMCIEDKLFPKTNSFIRGEQQPLAEVDEFAGKIRAAKDAQTDPDFVVVARVEALIAGWDTDEALRRANAYAEAGADAVLIHSKRSTPHEILAFMERWKGRCPVVIVPTTYFQTPVDVFAQAGVSLVIWANHLLRGALDAMKDIAATIHRERSIAEVFRLEGEAELAVAEQKYLPARSRTRSD
jgi:phosphoenolpyruvate phosphomutase